MPDSQTLVFAKCRRAALIPVLLGLIITGLPLSAQAQTFQVLSSFSYTSGSVPMAGLVMDHGGNLYGTTRTGGDLQGGYYCMLYQYNGCGTVFKLTRHGSSWLYSTLYEFHSYDGAYPQTAVTIAPNGVVYGSTGLGGRCGSSGFGCGTVFDLSPGARIPKTAISPWSETVLWGFSGGIDGGPYPSDVVFDSAGNIYGTTVGGYYGAGNVFEMTPSGNYWNETNLYSFLGGADGLYPHGVTFGPDGNLYGATRQGGNSDCSPFQGCGTIFMLTPSGSGWTKTIIHIFDQNSEGGGPGAVILDQAGNIYGATTGDVNAGIVFELSPSNGTWTLTVLYRFTGYSDWGPDGRLTMDAAGNLYGVTNGHGPANCGIVFKLSPSNGSWAFTDLHEFTGKDDGCYPDGFVTLDAGGNIYGTASEAGSLLLGTVWEITP